MLVTAQPLKDKDRTLTKGLGIILNGCCSRLNNGLPRFQVLVSRTFESYLLSQNSQTNKQTTTKPRDITDEIKLRIVAGGEILD